MAGVVTLGAAVGTAVGTAVGDPGRAVRAAVQRALGHHVVVVERHRCTLLSNRRPAIFRRPRPTLGLPSGAHN